MNKQEQGILAKDMNVNMLKELALSLNIMPAGEVAKMKKIDLLKAIIVWENKAVEQNTDKATGLRKLGGSTVPEQDMYNGKAVQSRTTRELNGKMYEDVLLVSGETFTNPITE